MDVNYRVVEADDPDTLRERVLKAMLDCWVLQGGVAIVACGDDGYSYAQAMTRSLVEAVESFHPTERGEISDWILVHEPDEPPVRWQCVICEALVGEPHAEGCRCKLVEGVPIDDEQ